MNKTQKIINVVAALLVILLGPLVIILTMDFSQHLSTGRFILEIVIRFLIVYLVIAIPAHFLMKRYK